MSDDWNAEMYSQKAHESLAGAESEYTNERYNNAANRAYYTAFQAAIAALLREGIRAREGRWAHTFVQSEFVGKLINRRHRFTPDLRDALSDLQSLRRDADYRDGTITRADARDAIRRSRAFVEAIRQENEAQ
ncbi:MAG: HEPN domain-containing protein [Thermomicrobiales bacterium]